MLHRGPEGGLIERHGFVGVINPQLWLDGYQGRTWRAGSPGHVAEGTPREYDPTVLPLPLPPEGNRFGVDRVS